MLQLLLGFLFVINWLTGLEPDTSKQIGKGIHPAVASDPRGGVHVVYGQGNTIFYVASRDGETFSTPVRVGSLPGLHIGASRGPQIAATARSVMITAIDKTGNVWAYVLNRDAGYWQPRVRINDVPDIAKEGFVALAAGVADSYNAVWLDLRGNKRNKLVGARSVDGGQTWTTNHILYQSLDGTVCECCQLSMVSYKSRVALMFRNFLNGSRDMYLLISTDNGQTFGKAEKLGKETWKLNACPMDGGGLDMTTTGAISTVWRRHDTLFTAKPGQAEISLATGKTPKIVSTAKGDYIVFQQNGQLMVLRPGQSQPKSMGTGAYPKLAILPNGRILCFWEQEGAVLAQIIY